MKQRKNYRVQYPSFSCSSCKHFDAIKQPIIYGDKGKEKVFICQLDHIPIEKTGMCDLYEGRR